jgi:hypothetical protein
LDENGHDPTRTLIEVYDHPQPPARVEKVLAIEALSSSDRIVLMMIRQ